jgi:hypothetical protein
MHLLKRMVTADDTVRRTHGLANVRISDQTLRRRLRESGLPSVMNPDFHFVLVMDVIVCTTGVRNVLRTSVCTSPTVLEAELLWSGMEFVMMVALS